MAETRKSAAAKAAETRAAQDEPQSTDERDAQAQEVVAAATPDGATDATTPATNLPPAGFLVDAGEPGDGKTLNSGTHLRNPATGEIEFLPAGSTLPEWATTGSDGMVGDHLLTAEPTTGLDPSVEVPIDGSTLPGVDAGRPRWAAYASAHGAVLGANATVGEIVAVLDSMGVPTS